MPSSSNTYTKTQADTALANAHNTTSSIAGLTVNDSTTTGTLSGFIGVFDMLIVNGPSVTNPLTPELGIYVGIDSYASAGIELISRRFIKYIDLSSPSTDYKGILQYTTTDNALSMLYQLKHNARHC